MTMAENTPAQIVCRRCRGVYYGQEIAESDPTVCRNCAGEQEPNKSRTVPVVAGSTVVIPSGRREVAHQDAVDVDWGTKSK